MTALCFKITVRYIMKKPQHHWGHVLVSVTFIALINCAKCFKRCGLACDWHQYVNRRLRTFISHRFLSFSFHLLIIDFIFLTSICRPCSVMLCELVCGLGWFDAFIWLLLRTLTFEGKDCAHVRCRNLKKKERD